MAKRALLVSCLTAFGVAGCEKPRIADPNAAVSVYAEAARGADSDAIYAMLSERSQRELGREGTRRLVADGRKELRAQADAITHKSARVEALAVVRYPDGEQAVLELEDGRFKIGSAAALPSAPRTPAQALGDLRQALARRSYAALLRVLSVETQSALENDVAAMVRGLEDPETLDVEVRGDAAQVELPGGHVVKLKRESGVWRVEDLR